MFDQLDTIDEQVAALSSLSGGDLAQYDGARLGDAIIRLDAAIRGLEAARLAVTRAHSCSLAWKRDGAKSLVQWHRDRRRGVSGGQAARDVDTAHALADMPRTAAAVADGSVTAAQAATAARARRGLNADETGDLDALVAQAGPTATDRQLRDAVTDYTHQVRADDVAERERQAHARRRLRLGRKRDGGWWLDGQLDVIGGELIATALSALSAPRGKDDDRTGEQRRADALADLADRAIRAGDLPAEGGHRPHVAASVGLDTLEARAGAGTGQLDHSGPVSGATLRQLACDADVHRVITDGASEVLDVGRGRRTVTRAQRRALAVRDGGCIGCDAPPGWTDAHHVVYWADGGPTDLENLALLCRSCHTSVHHRDWRITRGPDGRHRIHRPPRRRQGGHPPEDQQPPGAPTHDGPPRQPIRQHRYSTQGDSALGDGEHVGGARGDGEHVGGARGDGEHGHRTRRGGGGPNDRPDRAPPDADEAAAPALQLVPS